MAGPRSRRAPAKRKTGLRLLISAKTGMGRGRWAAASEEQRPAREVRSGETNRGGEGMSHQPDSGLPPVSVDERKNSPGQTAGANRPIHGFAHEFGSAGVAPVRFHDHAIAGGQGRGGVAAGHGEGEGEIARAEVTTTGPRGCSIRRRSTARQRLPLRLGAGSIRASTHEPSRATSAEKPQLPAGPRPLAGQPGEGQAGLLLGARAAGRRAPSISAAMAWRKSERCFRPLRPNSSPAPAAAGQGGVDFRR